MKVLFAHNTFSSYKPKNFISKIFNIWAKCQNKNIRELYESGVRGFDFRVRCDESEWLIPCHGIVDYDTSITECMNTLKSLSKDSNDNVYIRIINEDTFHKSESKEFTEKVASLMQWFPDFKYEIWYSKKQWKCSLSEFEEPTYELCASKIFPFTPKYVAKMNGWQYNQIYENLNKGFLFLDFV